MNIGEIAIRTKCEQIADDLVRKIYLGVVQGIIVNNYEEECECYFCLRILDHENYIRVVDTNLTERGLEVKETYHLDFNCFVIAKEKGTRCVRPQISYD